MSKKSLFAALAAVFVGVLALSLMFGTDSASNGELAVSKSAAESGGNHPSPPGGEKPPEPTEPPVVDDEPPGGGDGEMTDEAKRAEAEERLVEQFDAETDRWMDAEKTNPPTLGEIESFHSKFKSLPKGRKDECLHRALNLVPDENVMLLASILMDRSEDKELVELVYNDILNRDEDVKKPILQQIFQDKTHPCWADTAWILDVTGELPKQKTAD